MNIIGKWKVKELLFPTLTGGVYKNFEPPFDNWTFDLF